MTNTILELHTTAILPSHRIWSLFGDVDWHDKSDTEDISCDAAFGPIQIKIRKPEWKAYRPHAELIWNTAISFHCEKSWNDVRMIHALEQCSNLYELIGGYYLVKEDHGDLGFIVKENKLILPEQYRDYFSKFPIAFDHITYGAPPQFSHS